MLERTLEELLSAAEISGPRGGGQSSLADVTE